MRSLHIVGLKLKVSATTGATILSLILAVRSRLSVLERFIDHLSKGFIVAADRDVLVQFSLII